jgi:aspartyl protease family protein
MIQHRYMRRPCSATARGGMCHNRVFVSRLAMRALLFCTLLLSGAAPAAEVSVLGVFSGKALLVVDGAPPKTYAVGDRLDASTTLVAVDGAGATIEENGHRSSIALGQYVGHAASGRGSVTLPVNEAGYFIGQGQINGVGARMLVDTGASMMALPASEALRFGVDYRKGRLIRVGTANGVTSAYVVKLDKVRIGDIELYQVDALVQESGLSLILLGNSFLNRCEMRRDARQLTLTQRF